ncbi:MAG: hypothetical protein KC944_06825 [Candidatus Omnitrophica bacterium]|nr:hypothetical protein [Candidatus Omnitrophota bacterium]
MLQPFLRLGSLWLISLFALLQSQSANGQQVRPLELTWEDNLLRIHADYLPGGSVEVWYLEAFCRKGATDRKWSETTIPHLTRLISTAPDRSRLELETIIEPGVVARHGIQSGTDEVAFQIELTNPTDSPADIQWAQPCIRVGRFTGFGQDDYWKRCFVFLKGELNFLNQIPRTQEALYHGGQVYVPRGVERGDVNPRPISEFQPDPPIMGCVSHDDHWILGAAWDSTQELFQGVIVCLHSDFRIGGLQPGEKKTLKGRIYLLPNDPARLLQRWKNDFGRTGH